MADAESRSPDEGAPGTIDSAQMWENMCLADELSDDCIALAEGLAAPPLPRHAEDR